MRSHLHLPVATAVRCTQTFPNLLGPINMYGPTEATAVTVQHVFPKAATNVIIGRPDANVHAYVVDSRLQAVPIGLPGELVLSGPRLALGKSCMSACGLLECCPLFYLLIVLLLACCRLCWPAGPDG